MCIYENVPPPSRRRDGKRDTATNEIGIIHGLEVGSIVELREQLSSFADLLFGWHGQHIDDGRHLGFVEQMRRCQNDTLDLVFGVCAGCNIADGDIDPAQELHPATSRIESLAYADTDVITTARTVGKQLVVATASRSSSVGAKWLTNANPTPARGCGKPHEITCFCASQ